MKWFEFAMAIQIGASVACAISHDVGPGSDVQGALPLPVELSSSCLDEVADAEYGLPEHLSCTGLYRDTAKRVVPAEVQGYSPGYSLWADDMGKARYVYLPPGTTIDASTPNYWVFPRGTRFWKEFQAPNATTPIETRLYLKQQDGSWAESTYEWNAARTDATRVDRRKNMMIGSLAHTLPEPSDCEDCHKGRKDRILGFEQVLLGMPTASGVTLADLVAKKRLKGFDGPTTYQVGDDPDSAEAHALSFLHVNCGVSCHNDNSNSTAHMVNMKLKLDPSQLEGGDTSEFDAVKTTVGVTSQSLKWPTQTRVVAGSPGDSLLLTLMSMRGDPMQQMPPLATTVVDAEDTEYVRTWIANLPKP